MCGRSARVIKTQHRIVRPRYPAKMHQKSLYPSSGQAITLQLGCPILAGRPSSLRVPCTLTVINHYAATQTQPTSCSTTISNLTVFSRRIAPCARRISSKCGATMPVTRWKTNGTCTWVRAQESMWTTTTRTFRWASMQTMLALFTHRARVRPSSQRLVSAVLSHS